MSNTVEAPVDQPAEPGPWRDAACGLTLRPYWRFYATDPA